MTSGLSVPLRADLARQLPRPAVPSRQRTANRQPEGPTAVSGDQASDLQLPGSGGSVQPQDIEDRVSQDIKDARVSGVAAG
jgi:hypothetical protein